MEKRSVEVVVISDLHLGTYGCQAQELYRYLKSVQPRILVLNGDIVDIWQFRRKYFPPYHLKVVKQLFSMAARGTQLYYLTGNHDEALRRFSDLQLGNITLADKLVLELDGRKAWIFHGDIFDRSIQSAKWLAKVGGWGYDALIRLNGWINKARRLCGYAPYSFSKQVKNSVKKAVKYITDFEDTAGKLALENGYDYVICGHIHQPQERTIENAQGTCQYLNSGDWVENLTALEYQQGAWTLYHHPQSSSPVLPEMGEGEEEKVALDSAQEWLQALSQEVSINSIKAHV